MAAAGLGADLGVAALAFLGTNVDNTIVTTAMVAGAPLPRARRIAAGQVVGFAAIVVVAAAGAALLREFSPATVGLLGLVPLGIGLHGVFRLLRSRASGTELADPGAAVARRAVGQSLTAAVVITISAGGDNLAAYIPLFRAAGATEIIEILVVFAVGEVLVTWVVLAGGRHPHARRVMTRLGAVAVPVLLCGVGLLVLAEAGTFSLL